MKNFRPAGDGDYEVGYGRPPKETRFTPGKSGNPKGRPKRKRSLAADLRKEVERMVELLKMEKGGASPFRPPSYADLSMRR